MGKIAWYWWVLIGVAALLIIGYFTNWFGMKKPTVILMNGNQTPSNNPVMNRVPNTTINVITSPEDLNYCNTSDYQIRLSKQLSVVQTLKGYTNAAYNTWLADKSVDNCNDFKSALATEKDNVDAYNNLIRRCYPAGPFQSVSSFDNVSDCLGSVNITNLTTN